MSSFAGSESFPGNFSTAELGLFWDLSQCELPEELNETEILERMRNSISSAGHRGHVSFNAYGDMTDHDFPSDAEVKLNHFLAGEKYAKDTKILEDVVAWASDNPEPSTLMLVMGSVSDELHEVVQLLKREKNYQTIFVHSPPPPTMVMLIPTTSSAGGN